MDLFVVDWQQLLADLVRLLLAFLFTLPVAWDRERGSRSMGLRTFPIVATASAGFVLTARAALGDDPQAQARIIQGLMTGIGFIGGGAIIKGDGTVTGTATAASIWATGIIGAAIAYGRLEIAILVSILNFILLRALKPIKSRMEANDSDI